MRFKTVIGLLFPLICASADAAIYSLNNLSAAIPDNDRNGIQSTMTIHDLPANSSILDLKVTINISGGYNGDVYAYLTHGTGFAVLLNRVGKTGSDSFGYGDAGFHITLDDHAAGDVHSYQTVNFGLDAGGLAGTWQPDGRNIDPGNVVDTTARTALLSSFNGLDPNGSWTLFFADVSTGEKSTLNGWSLEVVSTPEPTTWALVVFGLVFAGTNLVRWQLGNGRPW